MASTKSEQKCLRHATQQADPAGWLSESAVASIATALHGQGVRAFPPALGSETDPCELRHPEVRCYECGGESSAARSLTTTATIVDVGQIYEKQHVPLRCRSRMCACMGQLQWYGYRVDKGKHIYAGNVTHRSCFMVSARFGFTTAWLEMFHERMLRQHVTFASEADVLKASASKNGVAHLLPELLRLKISEAWFKWRFAVQQANLAQPGEFELSASVEALLEPVWPNLLASFENSTADRARALGLRCDALALDGNAKNRRATCAMHLQGNLVDHALGKRIRTCCWSTPKLGSKFCSAHGEGAKDSIEADMEVEILNHDVGAGAALDGDEVKLLVKETSGMQREAWLSEHLVDDGLVKDYFWRVGLAKISSRAKKIKRGRGVADPQPSSEADSGAAQLQEMAWASSPEDIDAVQCKTHKETAHETNQLQRTAGILCACLSSGIVCGFREIFGAESLSQRYMFLSSLVELLPELELVVHDDSCHVHRFAERRAGQSARANRLAPPRVQYVCDLFHSSGHVDEWCKEHCNPRSEKFKPLLEEFRTSVCEFTFTWLSRYKHQTKHMSRLGFNFFLLEMISAHNGQIFAKITAGAH
jgi:hypothetical protein